MNTAKATLLFTLILSFMAGWNLKPDAPKSTLADSVELLPLVSSLDKSNLEWLLTSVVSAPKQFVESIISTATLKGKVVEVVTQSGSAPITAKHYYVGRLGFYDYKVKIILEDGNGQMLPVLLSPQRVSLMKVIKMTNNGEQNSNITDIKPGDIVHISEEVDLHTSNINDQNVKSVLVKVVSTP